MRKVRVSILGAGVVGGRFLQDLLRSRQQIMDEYQVELEIAGIYVNNLEKERADYVDRSWLSDDIMWTVDASDVIVECIGGNGSEQTYEAIRYALQKGKQVIMSSKKCLASHGRELTKLAREHHVRLCYDASVGGGIPISTVLEHMGKCESIEEIYGICNATSNYILTKMQQEGCSYADALGEAQRLGLAENDPTEDVDGWDTLYKAIILAGFGFGQWQEPQEIQPGSIRNMELAREDEVTKLVFSIKKQKNGKVTIQVGPQLIPANHILSNVSGENNLIIIRSSESGERAFYGAGAGAGPTASAMFDDLLKIID